MVSKEKLLQRPNYLLTKYQIEIFRQLTNYMKENDLTQKQVAEKLGVSKSYVNQILKGKFNFTLKKLIELSLLIGKVPTLEFVSVNDYIQKEYNRTKSKVVSKISTDAEANIIVEHFSLANMSVKVTGDFGAIKLQDFSYPSLN